MGYDGSPLPLPVVAVNAINNAALAAGAEATVVVPVPAPGVPALNPAPGAGPVFALAAVLEQGALTANVQYVAQVDGSVALGAASVNVKVKNVGTAAGAHNWTVVVLFIPFGVAIGFGA